MAKIYCHINQCDASVQSLRYCMLTNTESMRIATKNFRHKIKQILHQYQKVLALYNIKGELGTDTITNNYC